ncbi:MAG: MotA/TolQ/ExbB proton channel family protein [Pseudomonadota bacterium]
MIKWIGLAIYLLLSLQVVEANQNEDTSVTKAKSLDELLNLVKKDQVIENKLNKKREAEFAADKSRQQQLLNEARAELQALEQRGEELQANFTANELELRKLYDELDIAQGNLKELFGVVRLQASEAASRIKNSIVSAEYPDRHDFLFDLAERKELPTIQELKQLWFLIKQEMIESSKITRFTTSVVGTDGKREERNVIRVGAFNLISDGEYMNFRVEGDTLSVEELVRQPSNALALAQDYTEATSGYHPLMLDPTLGVLLAKKVQEKTPIERYHEGGLVGYIITGVLIIGLIIVLERLITLSVLSTKIRGQIKNNNPGNNPLGRIMSVYLANKDQDVENLELKLDEALLKEMPAIERGINFVKVLAAVSPLLGLFGTVTGMIQTFQAITLFGTSDPKLMAGGISTALMTTVLGLISAIPLIITHSMISARSKRLVHVLEEQSVGLIAQHAEKR